MRAIHGLIAALGIAVVTLAILLLSDRGATQVPAPPHRAPATDGAATGGPHAEDRPGSGGSAAMEVVVPVPVRADLSPLLAQAGEWPAPDQWQPVPATPAGAIPPVAVRNLQDLVEHWLAADLRPDAFESALGRDASDRLFVRLSSHADPRIQGRASCDLTPGMVTFAFTLEFPAPIQPMDLAALLARLRTAVPAEVMAELGRPDGAPHPHPKWTGPEYVSAVARLDRDGCGAIHPYLYLFATPTRLLGIYQQIPHGTAPADAPDGGK